MFVCVFVLTCGCVLVFYACNSVFCNTPFCFFFSALFPPSKVGRWYFLVGRFLVVDVACLRKTPRMAPPLRPVPYHVIVFLLCLPGTYLSVRKYNDRWGFNFDVKTVLTFFWADWYVALHTYRRRRFVTSFFVRWQAGTLEGSFYFLFPARNILCVSYTRPFSCSFHTGIYIWIWWNLLFGAGLEGASGAYQGIGLKPSCYP